MATAIGSTLGFSILPKDTLTEQGMEPDPVYLLSFLYILEFGGHETKLWPDYKYLYSWSPEYLIWSCSRQ